MLPTEPEFTEKDNEQLSDEIRRIYLECQNKNANLQEQDIIKSNLQEADRQVENLYLSYGFSLDTLRSEWKKHEDEIRARYFAQPFLTSESPQE